MDIGARLVFHGLVRPNVEIASREPADYAGLDAPVSIAKFHVPTVKPPKPVFYDAPLQWWRNFPEIDFDADVSVLGWARKFGDPFAEGPHFRPTDTIRWPRLAVVLNGAANLWSDPTEDENGISRIFYDTGAAADALTSLLDWTGPLDWTPKPNELDGTLQITPTVQTLERFMVLSAVFDIHDRTLMKRCRFCGDFFAPLRTDAMFCSTVCRQASFQAAKAAQAAVELEDWHTAVGGVTFAGRNPEEKK